MRKSWSLVVAALAVCLGAGHARAGQIFITAHDPEWHAHFGPNQEGAWNLAHTAIAFARGGSTRPFLYVESTTAPVPVGNEYTAPFLTRHLGYAKASFQVADAATLNGFADFRAALDNYSALVVASDHGGMLTGAELSFLNAHRSDIADYLNAGGGLAAFAESNAKGLLGGETPYGFVPVAVSGSGLSSFEAGNTVTALGAALGLRDADVNGNYTHSYFTATGGLAPVDLFRGDPGKPLTLATAPQGGGPVGAPEPSGLVLFVCAAGLLGYGLRRKGAVVG